MSSLYQGVCFPTEVEARQAACSAAQDRWGSGSSSFSTECTTVDFSATEMTICKREDGGPCSVIVQPWPVFPECDFSGGVSFAQDWLYLVLPVMATLWGLKRLIGLFAVNREEA